VVMGGSDGIAASALRLLEWALFIAVPRRMARNVRDSRCAGVGNSFPRCPVVGESWCIGALGRICVCNEMGGSGRTKNSQDRRK